MIKLSKAHWFTSISECVSVGREVFCGRIIRTGPITFESFNLVIYWDLAITLKNLESQKFLIWEDLLFPVLTWGKFDHLFPDLYE